MKRRSVGGQCRLTDWPTPGLYHRAKPTQNNPAHLDLVPTLSQISVRLSEGLKTGREWVWFPRLYGDDIQAHLEDEEWCEHNHIRGSLANDKTEKILLRDESDKYKVSL